MNLPWDFWFWWIPVLFIGSCVGSFLNVVIYRVPLGMSVNEPKRSFCPGCQKDIPWQRNLPLLTWLLQRGRCAECKMKIPARYFWVELLTTVLWAVAWWLFGRQGLPGEAFLLVVLISLLVAISFIDGEHYIIPVGMTWVGAGVGILGAIVFPELVSLSTRFSVWPTGWGKALFGFALGYASLQLIVWMGKLAFGKQVNEFKEAKDWLLREPEADDEMGQLTFVINGEEHPWGDMFYRKTDRLMIQGEGFLIDGKAVEGTEMTIREETVSVGEKTWRIEEMVSLSGKATKTERPREAMGGGDPPLLAMIGAFLGWQAVVFTIFASSIYAIIAALLMRVGFGRPLPYGPFLALAGLTWAFGGWQIWEWYTGLIQGPPSL